MFYRICKFLTHNIRLVFVFDGPGVPAKRGRNGGRKIDWERLRLLKNVLRCLGVPYQEAPGEAEAECARLQTLGIVDAVFSQDSDCLMFGCSLWLHDDRVAKEKGNRDRGKENTRKSDKNVRMVRAKDMKDQLNLDREGLVMFAMLVGGDYHPTGLPGCGPAIALAAVKEGKLAQALCLCRNQRDCSDWGFRLAAFLQTRFRGRAVQIPSNFPDFKILQKYYRPKVTSDELLKSNKSLNLAADRPVDEPKLLDLTSKHFNIWGRLYMNWVGPVLLTQSLSRRGDIQPKEVVHGIKLTKQRASKSEEVISSRSLERTITFSPFGVTNLRREDFEGGDRDGMWEGKIDVPFDPTHRVKCEYFPAFWLQRVLPPEVFDPPPLAPKQKPSKRKEQPEVEYGAKMLPTPARKKQRPQGSGHAVAAGPRFAEHGESTPADLRAEPIELSSAQPPNWRSNGKQKDTIVRSASSKPWDQQRPMTKHREVIDLSNLSDDDVVLRHPPNRQIRKSPSLRTSLSNIVDLGSPQPSADESEEDEDLVLAMRLSMHSSEQANEPLNAAMVSRDASIPRTPSHNQTLFSPRVPTMAATRASPCRVDEELPTARLAPVAIELTEIRAARLKHFVSNPVPTPQRTMPEIRAVSSGVGVGIDCIDLTGD